MDESLLQRYISQQSAVWKALLDKRESLTAPFAVLEPKPDRVILIGSGSSHYAALMGTASSGAGVRRRSQLLRSLAGRTADPLPCCAPIVYCRFPKRHQHQYIYADPIPAGTGLSWLSR